MRSRPYKPPPPLPPLLDELSTYLPNSDSRRPSNDDSEVPLSELDPESGRLLSKKPRQHRVRVQGKLALVHSVSVADLQSTPTGNHVSSPRTAHRGNTLDSGVGGTVPTRRRRRRERRRSLDDISDSEEDISERDTQPRGYGIGGAGNIRRPTEVMGTPTRSSPLLAALLSPSGIPTTPPGIGGDRKKWNIREFLGKVSDRKGKGKEPPIPEGRQHLSQNTPR